MPPAYYVWLPPDTKMTPAEREQLIQGSHRYAGAESAGEIIAKSVLADVVSDGGGRESAGAGIRKE